MKRKVISAIAAIITLLFIQSCVVRKSEPVTNKYFVPANSKIANGEIVFMAFCNKCHPAGESGLGPAINSNPAPQFIKRFQMRHGIGVMPGFKKTEISKSDLKAISRYLRAWKTYQ
jgi:mono/diheme cytochrome c family protein